jgi:hypothetical protein
MVTDARRRRVLFDQAVRGVAMDAVATVRRKVVEERVTHETVAEPIAGARGLDDQRGVSAASRCSNASSSGRPEQSEVVGVERRSDNGHAEHLTRRRRDATDHVGVERLHPLWLVGSPAGELVDRNGMPRLSAAICSTNSGAGSRT